MEFYLQVQEWELQDLITSADRGLLIYQLPSDSMLICCYSPVRVPWNHVFLFFHYVNNIRVGFRFGMPPRPSDWGSELRRHQISHCRLFLHIHSSFSYFSIRFSSLKFFSSASYRFGACRTKTLTIPTNLIKHTRIGVMTKEGMITQVDNDKATTDSKTHPRIFGISSNRKITVKTTNGPLATLVIATDSGHNNQLTAIRVTNTLRSTQIGGRLRRVPVGCQRKNLQS